MAFLPSLSICLPCNGNWYEKAKELLERALVIQEKHYGPDHSQVAITLTDLGIAHYALGDLQKAKELFEQALPIFEKHYGLYHFKVAITLADLGINYGNLGDHKKKKELLERALPIFEKHYGSDHFEVAIILADLGSVDKKYEKREKDGSLA